VTRTSLISRSTTAAVCARLLAASLEAVQQPSAPCLPAYSSMPPCLHASMPPSLCAPVLRCLCAPVLRSLCAPVLRCLCAPVLRSLCAPVLRCLCAPVLRCLCAPVLRCLCAPVLRCLCAPVLRCLCAPVLVFQSSHILAHHWEEPPANLAWLPIPLPSCQGNSSELPCSYLLHSPSHSPSLTLHTLPPHSHPPPPYGISPALSFPPLPLAGPRDTSPEAAHAVTYDYQSGEGGLPPLVWRNERWEVDTAKWHARIAAAAKMRGSAGTRGAAGKAVGGAGHTSKGAESQAKGK
ncbi:unnamed protein product, partial [Closterium sp. Yama58-4]